MSIKLEDIKEVKGAIKAISKSRIGRSLREYTIEAQRIGRHVNDGGRKLMTELSKKNKHLHLTLKP